MNLPRIPQVMAGDPRWFADIKRWCEDMVRYVRDASPIGDGRTVKVTNNVISAITTDDSFIVVHTAGSDRWKVRCGFAITPSGEHYPTADRTPDVLEAIADVPADPDDFSVYAHIDETSNLAGSIVFKADDTPASADITVVRLADVVANRIYQHQQGTIIIGGGTEVDGVSLDENDDGKAQVYKWDEAETSGDEDFNDQLFPYKDFDTEGLLYVDGNDLLGWIESSILLLPSDIPIDFDSLDIQDSGDSVQVFQWDQADQNNLVADPLTPKTLIPCKRWDGANWVDDLVYYTVEQITGAATDWWELNGTFATCYGQSIGSSSTNQVIDLTNSSLTGDWATDGDFNLSGAGKVYKAQGSAGVTGDGFTGGIKTDDTAMRAEIESQVQDILAGVGGLL